MEIEKFRERHDTLMRYAVSDTEKVEAAHLIGWVLAATELQQDLLAEVERLQDALMTAITYINQPDIDDDSYTLTQVNTVLFDALFDKEGEDN